MRHARSRIGPDTVSCEDRDNFEAKLVEGWATHSQFQHQHTGLASLIPSRRLARVAQSLSLLNVSFYIMKF